MTAVTYDEMRPGCYDRDDARQGLRAQLDRRLAPVPHVPALLRPDVLRDARQGPRARVREGVQRLDGRGVVRAVGRREHPAVHHAAVGRRARGRRDPAQRGSRRARVLLQRDAAPPRAADDPQRARGTRCSRCATTPASRCACTSARRRPTPRRHPTRRAASAARSRSTTRWRRSADWLFSGKLIQFPKLKLAYSEGQIGWIPYALERADTVWDKHDAWQKSKELIPEPPSSYYYGRIFGCFTADHHGLHSLGGGRRGQHLLRDRLPAHRHDVAELEGVHREDARRLRRRRRVQGAARQRDQDAGARPRLERVHADHGAELVGGVHVRERLVGTGRPSFSQMGSQPSPGR